MRKGRELVKNVPWACVMENIPLATVNVGERRREEMGDIDALADSIRVNGLLHPIVVDDKGNLIAGHRRLEACKKLGWGMIPVRRIEDVSPERLHELELRENLDRKDFTELELSKNMSALAASVGERLRNDFQAGFAEKSGMGRPAKPDSQVAIAREIGVPQRTIGDAIAHVKAVEQYPVLEPLPKSTVIGITREAKKQPEPTRTAYVSEQAEQWYQKECKKIDEETKIANAYRDAVFGILTLPISEDGVQAWISADAMGRDLIIDYEDDIDRAIDKLKHLKQLLRGNTKIRAL